MLQYLGIIAVMNEHIKKAIEIFDGSQTKLANAIGGRTGQGHVHQWLYGLKNPSPENAVKINKVTGGRVKASSFHAYLTDIDIEHSAHG